MITFITFALSTYCLSGGIGRHVGFKIQCFTACRFDSGLRYLKRKALYLQGFVCFAALLVVPFFCNKGLQKGLQKHEIRN